VLTARQRALLHELSESHGWGHASAGDGDARRLQLGALHDPEAPRVVLDGDAPLTDEALGALLAQHLPLPPGALVAASARGAAAPRSAPHARGADGVRSTSAPAVAAAGRHYDSVDAFVTHMTRLIDLERAAEVAAAHDAAAASSASAAQARGVCLINLRVSESEGGLLGRTLLTLVPNKGYGSTPPPLLPAHKFGPHDVVALRPSAGGAGGPPLCSGLVYRCEDRQESRRQMHTTQLLCFTSWLLQSMACIPCCD
jgi:ATP-dependent RNA/DNA helicase IGHMBP2